MYISLLTLRPVGKNCELGCRVVDENSTVDWIIILRHRLSIVQCPCLPIVAYPFLHFASVGVRVEDATRFDVRVEVGDN